MDERSKMIDPKAKSESIARQRRLLGLRHSGLYYKPAGESEQNMALMRQMNEHNLEPSFEEGQIWAVNLWKTLSRLSNEIELLRCPEDWGS